MLDANIVKIVKKNKSITQSDLISKLSKEFKIHFNVKDYILIITHYKTSFQTKLSKIAFFS